MLHYKKNKVSDQTPWVIMIHGAGGNSNAWRKQWDFLEEKYNLLFAIKCFVHLARFFNLFLSYPQMYRLFSYLLIPRERQQVSRRLYQLDSLKISNTEYIR